MNETDIANLALGRLGIGQAIASLSEQSAPARICNRFYHHCRRELLQSFPWGHASSLVALAELADESFAGWQYCYAYPTNTLRVWAVSDSSGIRLAPTYVRGCCRDQRESSLPTYLQPFRVAMRSDAERRMLISDVQTAYAFVTYDVTNTGAFPADFAGVLAWRLAMEVGGPLKVAASFSAQARSEYLFWKSHAAARDMNEQRDDLASESPSVLARM